MGFPSMLFEHLLSMYSNVLLLAIHDFVGIEREPSPFCDNFPAPVLVLFYLNIEGAEIAQ